MVRLAYFLYLVIFISFAVEGISFLIRKKNFGLLCPLCEMDFTTAPYGLSLFFGIVHLGFPLYGCFRLWREKDCNILQWFAPQHTKEEQYFHIDIDLIKSDDFSWRKEIREQAKKKKLIAYSKKGAKAAKLRAKRLNIEDCFVDFKDYDAVKNINTLTS